MNGDDAQSTAASLSDGEVKNSNEERTRDRCKKSATALAIQRRRSFCYLPDPINGEAALTNSNALAMEWTLRRLMEASAELMACDVGDCVLKNDHVDPDIDPRAFWSMGLANFRHVIPSVVTYVKHMPAFLAMPMCDRCRLFSHSFLPLKITQLCRQALPLNYEANAVFGWNSYNRAMFFQKFPQFLPLNERLNEVGHVLHGWRPSDVETSLLLASLFYQDTLPGLINPMLVFNVSQRLKLVLNAVSRQYSDGDLRLRYFVRTFDLLRCAQQCAVEASTALFNAGLDLPNDGLFTTMYVRRGGHRRSSSPFCNSNESNNEETKQDTTSDPTANRQQHETQDCPSELAQLFS